MRKITVTLLTLCVTACGQLSAEEESKMISDGKTGVISVTLLARYGAAVRTPELCTSELPCRADLKKCRMIQSPHAQRQLLATVPALATERQRATERFLVNYDATLMSAQGKCELRLKEITAVERAKVQVYR